MTSLSNYENSNAFISRHIGPNKQQQKELLAAVDAESLDQLSNKIVPENIQFNQPLALNNATTETESLSYLKSLAQQNIVAKSYIGMGYYDTEVPTVIQRNVLENPGWYTAYTPYQPEIAQGRLEALMNFQQVILDLTAMDIANASLLDEATAAAEAMAMAKRCVKRNKSNRFFVDKNTHPQTIDVLRTRAEYFEFELVVDDLVNLAADDVFAAFIQYPGSNGQLSNPQPFIDALHEHNALAIVATDLMALCLLKAPGEMNADIVLGSSQRFGIPMGFGGPHAAFFATREDYKRAIPGRIIGLSKDSADKPAYRMALQTREQHIRREKATSNICTSQVLLANMAGFYAVYHGADGIRQIAKRIHHLTGILAEGLESRGVYVSNTHFFDTISFTSPQLEDIKLRATAAQVNLRFSDNLVGISINETTTSADIEQLFDVILGSDHGLSLSSLDQQIGSKNTTFVPENLERKSAYLTHPVFNSYQSETNMLRYLKKLENKDLALNHSMIALGSCTMKLNATAQMMPVTWETFGRIHPFAPSEQTQGYQKLLAELQQMLEAITGFDAVSLQPNSGAQGEYAGLLAIRKYQEANGEANRDICLIPQSAHGTNPASAQMMGLKVVVVNTDEQGNIDIDDLKAKAEKAGDNLSCMMVTYPSTYGVYEAGIKEVCQVIHQHGGQVYMDGANLNAQVGLSRPADIGADVAHMNLHKTFAIPHGGGGPGMGPIGVVSHLKPHLPNHSVAQIKEGNPLMGAVSAAPYGSASILPISWMYIRLLGANGLKEASQVAILNANYVAKKLAPCFPILYTDANGYVAHECIIDLRPLKAATGISEVDIAKRLMDFGFHAPTMSFPVPGTFMIEPTESESKEELDRFIEAMTTIYQEIQQVENGSWSLQDNPLVNAPHSQADLLNDWQRSYSREQAVFPLTWVAENKFWPSVNRIDDAWGDRNLFCSCPDTSSYQEQE
ncbi:aminomethyl-transferring glycine dehydrogenase [Reinekea thalattae]|uniref:Glycine dehydrogenase (decarboxylating) n=1 Tax=Reinekea thalattae TaxID=2593301 RepID=A0A5C8Z8S6_9GAMM|nr:aminomethyl-transferring glycine dehydrogenase [Reinekea thalattae]TXR53256.1 aminomethyl-transferring glycine dehydrogenase [Reinekea thalattae]